MHLYLIRHARPQVASGMCYGSTDLAVEQSEQALQLPSLMAELRARLAADSPACLPRTLPIFSSPLQRCSQLAHSLADTLQASPPVHDARLVEMDFGAWEMRNWDDIPRAEVDAWTEDLVRYRPGGGENVLQVAARVQAFDRELCARGYEAAIVVCHAGTIRLLRACLQHAGLPEIALHAAATPHKIAYGSVTVLKR